MRILFVGGGNMAIAMIGGLLARQVPASSIGVVEISADARQTLRDKYSVATYASVGEAPVAPADVIVLAVKPQQARVVAGALAPLLGQALVLSIAAGIRVEDLSRWLGGYPNVVRSMPNTPALIRSGVTGLYAPPEVSAASRNRVEDVVAAIGSSFWVDNEAMMDAVTAVSGSGPAYVFYVMEALQKSAESFGFSAERAHQMALETVLGAARLAAEGGDGFDVLRQRVTSKGGTTEAALQVMGEAGVAEGLIAGVKAAAKRGRELGELMGKEA